MKSIKKSQTRAMLQQYDLGYPDVTVHSSSMRVPKHVSPAKKSKKAAAADQGYNQD